MTMSGDEQNEDRVQEHCTYAARKCGEGIQSFEATDTHPAANRKSTPHVIRSIAQNSNDLGNPAPTM